MSLSRHNRLYQFFINSSFFTRALITLVFLFSIFMLWFMLLFSSSRKRTEIEKSEIINLQKRNELMQSIINEVTNSNFEINKLSNEIKNLLIDDKKARVFEIENLIHCAKLSEVNLISCIPEKQINKKYYSKTYINFKFTGSFSGVFDFLSKINDEINILKYKNIKIQRLNNNQLELQFLCIFFTFEGNKSDEEI